ncbi:MAG: IPT/TIG domain-containing protein [Candidatus Sumerlaeota bacterium]|nr:IPT/TIG domain-containing protein [Candidatus Sumerlaeota bacterium]
MKIIPSFIFASLLSLGLFLTAASEGVEIPTSNRVEKAALTTETRKAITAPPVATAGPDQVHASSGPIIYRLDPPEAWYQGSWNPMTIRGANLAGTSKVTIGGNLATSLTAVDDSTVTFKAPAQVPSPVTSPSVAYAKVDLVLTTRNGAVTLPKAVQYSPPPGTGVTAKGSDWAVLVEAVVAATPSPSITLKWPLESRATGYEISRKARSDNVWVQVGAVANPGSATSWQDTNVAVGQAYEYRVKRTTTILAYTDSWAPRILAGLTSYGYIYSGINMPPVDHRGTVILIADNTIAGACSAELAMLRDDLIGDGWSVIRHDVERGTVNSSKGPGAYEKTGAPAVKQLIVNEYLKNPKEVKSVFLFGHVPVPYSGNFTPTGHAPGHTGAFPADVYYGDVDGVFTDSVVDVQTADANSYYYTCWNIPGDGKFDQSWAPSEVELEVGRVDLWGMAANETALLKQYITKSHNHRHALNVAPRRTLMMEGSGDNWLGISQGGWRSWAPLVGAGNLITGWFYDKLVTNNEAYLGFCLTGSGDNARVGSGNRTTTVYSNDFLNKDIKATFCMSWGSHHGDWDHGSNLLRAPLTSANYGLASMYAFNPSGYLHTLGLGGDFGEAIRLKQNNTTTYSQYDPSHSGGVHIALMGDPTLRLFAVKPPSALTVSKDGNHHPMLSWQASTDSSLLGYYVYRSTDRNGPFTRLTPHPVIQTTWTDSSITAGTFTYQVKAAKLETTASGTYTNTSQAIADTVIAAPNPAGILEFSSSNYAQDEGASSPLKIVVTRTGGSSGAVSVSYSTSGGTATPGADYTNVQNILTWADGDLSPKSFTVPFLNDLTVEPDETINLALSSPTGRATLGTSAAVLTIANDDSPGTIYQVSPVAVKEGNSGITRMTITCLRVGGATGRVELNYATCAPGRMVSINYPTFPSAYPWLSDYDSAQGTLIWADGDKTPKTFDINIHGNLKANYNKFIPIHYSATGGATVKHPESFHNYILNDD